MTREEAWRRAKGYLYDALSGKEADEIIELLEAEATELQKAYNKGFEDCRQAVLDELEELNAISFYEAQEDSMECYREIKQMIKQLPPVKPKEPKAEPKYCDRNICIKNEYNGMGCDECEVMAESEEVKPRVRIGNNTYYY